MHENRETSLPTARAWASLGLFRERIARYWARVLRRHSQKGKVSAIRLGRRFVRWLPRPKVVHPYPEQRFAVSHPRRLASLPRHRFVSSVGIGVLPAKLHEKPAVGSAGGLAAGAASEAGRTQPYPWPLPWPLDPGPCFSTLLGWAFRPRNFMKNRRLVAPAVSPPVALADRRQDRRCYPFTGRFFRLCLRAPGHVS